jgi:hypothetical protein
MRSIDSRIHGIRRTSDAGLQPLLDIKPTAQEQVDGMFYHSLMNDMFWVFDEKGRSCTLTRG